jgi:hypothetical protein
MTMLRDLLTTWENWSARDTLTRALADAVDDTRTAHLAETPTISAIDALRDNVELVELLTGWRWQAMYAARRDGATWEQIASVSQSTVDIVRAAFHEVIERQEKLLEKDVRRYREVL